DLLRRKFWKLTQDGGAQVVVGDDPETAPPGHGCEARDGLLEHGLLAIEREQLRGSAASEDYWIEVRVRLHGNRNPIIYAPVRAGVKRIFTKAGTHAAWRLEFGLPCVSLCPLLRMVYTAAEKSFTMPSP